MTPFIGQIQPLGFNFAPRGWALCDGQLMPIAQWNALFSLYGTIYGGDGRTTFGLPDLRGRVMMHFGTGPGLPTYRQGAKSGQTTVTLTTLQIPSHNHIGALNAGTGTATSGTADGNALAHETRSSGDVPDIYVSGVTPNIAMHNGSVAVGNTGGGQDHNNMQPYLVINISCALEGIFPSRS